MSQDWFPIPMAVAGRLVIVARPRGNDWLVDDVAAWKRQGVTTVVSLLAKDEAESLGLAEEAKTVESAGMKFVSFPIDDLGIPQQKETFLDLTAELARRISAGETVAMHCRQGLGRAPLTAIGVLQALGFRTDSAVEAVSQARGRSVPETLEQRYWLDHLPSLATGATR